MERDNLALHEVLSALADETRRKILLKLKEGKITLDELADWFGIAASTMRAKKTKENKLKILKTFADYHLEKRSIVIDKVYIPVYTKAYTLIKE